MTENKEKTPGASNPEKKLQMRIENFKMYIDICKHYTTLISGLIVVLVSAVKIFPLTIDSSAIFYAALTFLGVALGVLLAAIFLGSICIEQVGNFGYAKRSVFDVFAVAMIVGGGLFLAGIVSLLLFAFSGKPVNP